MPDARDRLAGFRASLAAVGRAEPRCVEGAFTVESGEAAMSRLLATMPEVDEVFCGNDLMAQGALLVLRDAGIAVPGRVAVVGDDDSAAARACRPTLTTIRQPIEDMAAAMARMLTAAIDDPTRPPARRLFRPTLVVRDSA